MPTNIDRAQVRSLLEQGAQLVETLPAKEFSEQHLPGAIHLPLRQIEKEADEKLDRTRPVIVYCYDHG